jgi:S1-C subfamily serine protease
MLNRSSKLIASLVLTLVVWLGSVPAQIDARTAAPPAQLMDSQAIIDVYQKASPSVVNITYSAEARDALGRRVRTESTGSGVIIDREGHVVTNQHVVGSADRLDVTVPGGPVYLGRIVASDRASDLAVIRIDAPAEALARLTPATLGDSGSLQVGQIVVAIGNPFGLERSASLGIISSLGRTRPGVDKRFISNMIQTDAAINPGNSGGPLLNLNGEVIGINEQIETSSEGGSIGVGFAIPINTVKRYLPELLAGREPQHAYIGVAGVALTPTRAERLGLSVHQGVILAALATDGPAAQAGLQAVTNNNASTGDIITGLNGQPVHNFQDIAALIDILEPGDQVTIQYIRAGETKTVTVTLGVWQSQDTSSY